MNKLSKTLLMASFTGTFAETMLLPIWATFTERVGGSVLDAGIGYAIFSIVTGLFVMIVGSTAWFNRNTRAMVFGGFLLAGIGDMMYMAVHNKWELFAVQCFIGISVGMLNPAWDSLYCEDEGQSDASRWSFWTGGINFIVGISAIVGSLIVTYLGFYWLFPIMAITDMAAVYYSWKVYNNEV
jgi:hypothetical protein